MAFSSEDMDMPWLAASCAMSEPHKDSSGTA